MASTDGLGSRRRSGSWLRRWRLVLRRRLGTLTLSQRFLGMALVVVTSATLILGFFVASIASASILDGVARTASSSTEALLHALLHHVPAEGELTEEDRAEFERVFVLGNEADSTRLLQLELRRPDGSLLYVADRGLEDPQPVDFAAALGGEQSASIVEVNLGPAGPLTEYGLPVLRIVTPVAHPEDRATVIVATLYFSARSLLEIAAQARTAVWSIVSAIGVTVVLALYIMVDGASRLISRQREHLASNLKLSRQLSEDNRQLHRASERLRLDASAANENLLARVGSDLHDGPLQLLTLLVLRLSSGPADKPAPAPPVELAQEAMRELRNISTGLVLPELDALTLKEAMSLAVTRFVRTTGQEVDLQLGALPEGEKVALRICAYRVIQESLNNGYQHGGTGKPVVAATAANDRLSLVIATPAGKNGTSTPRSDDPPLGLAGMRIRVGALGGTLSVVSGDAVTVRAELPLNRPGL